jgi:hypothetical protein
VNVDGYLAGFGIVAAPGVEMVAHRLPAGDGTSGVLPDPLGIALGRVPALVFQTANTAEDDSLIARRLTRDPVHEVDERPTQQAVAGRRRPGRRRRSVARTPDEPVSVKVR